MLKKKGIISLIFVVICALFLFTGTADAAGGCKDRDNDGYFNKAGCGTAVDCDDQDAAVNPAAVEECTDGIDNDCDGLIDIQDPDAVNCPVCNNDSDGDGYYTDGGACGAVDCDDTDPAINPGAVEICDDPGLVDEDCDGLANGDDPDCGAVVCSSYTNKGDCNMDPNCEWVGSPKNGSCQDAPTCTITEDPEVTCDDGVDNDCDGATDTADTDCQTGGQQDCLLFLDKNSCNAQVNCQWSNGQKVCNYQCQITEDPEVSCGDGFDNDCDGLFDSADPDCLVCTDVDGDTYSPDGGPCGAVDCNDNDPAINPGASEVCDNLDNDCDGTIDGITRGTTCGVGECSGNTGVETCTAGVWGNNTCDPFAGAAPDDSICNGLDDDCDSPVDEDFVISTTSCGTGVCSSTGLLECLAGVEVDSCTPGSPTEVPEATCDDGLDNDCDGLTDDPDDPDCGGAGPSCVECHSTARFDLYNPRQITGSAGDFMRLSRHVGNGTTAEIVTSYDCAVCHAEGDVSKINSGTGWTSDTLHNDGTTATSRFVNLRNVDDHTQNFQFNKFTVDEAMRTDMDSFCMGCHDVDGANDIAVNDAGDGLLLPPTLDANRWNPFNPLDDISANGRDSLLTRTRVIDVKGQFNPGTYPWNVDGTMPAGFTGANYDGIPSQHNVLGPRYATNDANWTSATWTGHTTRYGQTMDTARETARLHCSDCHLTETNGHGAANSWHMLLNSTPGDFTTDATQYFDESVVCYKCHSSNYYANVSQTTGTRFSHDADGNTWGDSYLFSGDPPLLGPVCLNCHGGDGYGHIHGRGSSTDGDGDGTFAGSTYTTAGGTYTKQRFMPGAWMQWDPGANNNESDWATATGSGTCYFPASYQWTNCTSHAASSKSGNTTNYGRPTTY